MMKPSFTTLTVILTSLTLTACATQGPATFDEPPIFADDCLIPKAAVEGLSSPIVASPVAMDCIVGPVVLVGTAPWPSPCSGWIMAGHFAAMSCP